MGDKAFRYCICDIHRCGTSGFVVIEEPATVLVTVAVPGTSLDMLAETMRRLQLEHGIRSFWVEAGAESGPVCDLLRMSYGLPARRVSA
jgi:hypothetical protein